MGGFFAMIGQLRTPVKLVLALLVVALGWGFFLLLPKAADKAASSNVPGLSTVASVFGGDKPMTLCVNTWGGFAGAQWMNGGFDANPNSRFTKDYGISVRFVKMDDFDASRAAFENGACDFVWATIDAFVTEAEALVPTGTRVPFQIDWSRGGDAVVARRDIKSINDLKGRSVGVAFGTPSHSLLLWLLSSSGMSPREVKIVRMKDEPAVVAAFKAGELDAGIVWSPDDADLVDAVPGAHVLTSTKQATDIIADTMLVKKSYLDAHLDDVVKLYEGWMCGNADVTNNPQAFREAAKITAAGYGMSEDFMSLAIKNTRLVTHGDNLNFFGLKTGFRGMEAEELYSRTGMLYQELGNLGGFQVSGFPSWKNVVDLRVVSEAKPGCQAQEAEAVRPFAAPTEAVAAAPAVTSKPVTVTFATGSAVLDDRNKSIIDRQLVNVARQFRASYIRIEGNTDSTGSAATNRALSRQRAAAVADYLASEHGLDRTRFVVRGNGPDKPVCDELSAGGSLEACRAQNRRTDFQVLEQP